MKTKRNIHGKTIFLLLSVALLLLAALSVGMTYGKYTLGESTTLEFSEEVELDFRDL